MRGRKPLPTELKLLQGTARKGRMNKREPKPTGPVTCPDWLSIAAKAEWRRIAPVLVRARIVTAADRATLAVYCQQWGRAVAAEQEVALLGDIVKSPSGYPIVNPHLGVANKAVLLMLKYAVELGITPSARTRVTAAPGDDKRGGIADFARQKGSGGL